MFKSTKIIELGSCAFRQPQATSHCRFLHGYRLIAKFWFEANELDENNWVVDFGGLKGLKKILENQFDHTTCISKDDPKLMLFEQMSDNGVCDLRVMDGVGIEKFAEYCHKVANDFVHTFTNGRCCCVKVEVFEHEKNSAIYENPTVTTPKLTEKQQEQLIQEVKQINKQSVIEDDNTLYDFMGNKDIQKTGDGTVVNTNKTKTVNKWVDPNSSNVWGI